MSSTSGSKSSRTISKLVGAVALLAILLLAGLAQAAKTAPIDTGDYLITYKAVGDAITINPSGVISFRDIVFNPTATATPIEVSTTTGTLTITINGKTLDQLSIKKKKGATTFRPVTSLESTGGFAKLYTDAEIVELRAAGNIVSLSSKNAVVDDAIASGFGTIKLANVTDTPGMEIDTWRTPTVTSVKPLGGKIGLTGISLENAYLIHQNAALTIAAKTLKTGTVAASVIAPAEITGEAVSVSVRGGDLMAETVQAQQGIKLLASTMGKDLKGGTVGYSLTSATLSVYLAGDAVALVQNSSSLFASGLNGSTDPKVQLKEGIGTVAATTAINGVFVAGGTQPAELLVEPAFTANVKTYKAPAATGDAFVKAAASKQPAGVIVHTSIP